MTFPPPAMPSQPPPPRPFDPHARPMSLAMACAWAFGAIFLFVNLVTVTVSLRPGAQHDLVNAFACQVAAYCVALFAILRVHAPNTSIRTLLGFRGTHAAFYPLAILLGLALEVPTNAIFRAILARWPSPDDELFELFTQAGGAKRLVIGSIVVALGPFLEEVFFRGALVQPLLRRHGAGLVIAFTAAFFAVAHLQWQMFLPIFVVGVALGLLRVASGSIVPSILLHATFNAAPFVALVQAARIGEKPADEPISIALVAGTTAASLVLFAAVAFLARSSAQAAAARAKDQR